MARVAFVGIPKMRAFNAPQDLGPNQEVRPRGFPLGRFWRPLHGVFVPAWAPAERRYDLLHTFNVVPFTTKPWIITFEDALPRVFFGSGYQHLEKVARTRLVDDNCRRIFAMSEYARNKVRQRHAGWKHLDALLSKTEVLHPGVAPQNAAPKAFSGGETIRLVFVGHAFARKGGIVALRLARMAQQAGFPLHIDLVSKIDLGDYADHLQRERYAADLKLLDLPNVTFHKELPGGKVLELMRGADFQLLATLADTYAYSIIEGFSVATPAIATRTCAVPENVRDGETGFLLDLPVNEWNDWVHIVKSRDLAYRSSDEFWNELNRAYDDLASQAFDALQRFSSQTAIYEELSANALQRANTVHNASLNGEKLNRLYQELAS